MAETFDLQQFLQQQQQRQQQQQQMQQQKPQQQQRQRQQQVERATQCRLPDQVEFAPRPAGHLCPSNDCRRLQKLPTNALWEKQHRPKPPQHPRIPVMKQLPPRVVVTAILQPQTVIVRNAADTAQHDEFSLEDSAIAQTNGGSHFATGDGCLVEVDGRIRRAAILEMHGESVYHVWLVDDGLTILRSDVRPLPERLARRPARTQMVTIGCRLSSVVSAERVLLGKTFDAAEGENGVTEFRDGKFDVLLRLGVRPRPDSALPSLDALHEVILLGRRGASLVAVLRTDIQAALKPLASFEKDPHLAVLPTLEPGRRVFVVVWHRCEWRRAQVIAVSDHHITVSLIDLALEAVIPKEEERFGVLPSWWRQPPAGALRLKLENFSDSQLTTVVAVLGYRKLRMRLQKPNVHTYTGQLYLSINRKGGSRTSSLVAVRRLAHQPRAFLDFPYNSAVEDTEDQRYHPQARRFESPLFQQMCDDGIYDVVHVDADIGTIFLADRSFEKQLYYIAKLVSSTPKRLLPSAFLGQAVLVAGPRFYYRAEVISAFSNGYVVRMVDFGTTRIVFEVFDLPQSLTSTRLTCAVRPTNVDVNDIAIGSTVSVKFDKLICFECVAFGFVEKLNK